MLLYEGFAIVCKYMPRCVTDFQILKKTHTRAMLTVSFFSLDELSYNLMLYVTKYMYLKKISGSLIHVKAVQITGEFILLFASSLTSHYALL